MTEVFLNRDKYIKIFKNCGIYFITNTETDDIYIGSSKNIKNRFANHKSRLRNNKHQNQHLQCAVNKYGIDNFTFQCVEHHHDISIIEKREKKLIEIFKPRYNIRKVEENNYVISDETKRKIGLKSKEKFVKNPKLLEIFKNAVKDCRGWPKGKKMSDEQRSKLSEIAKKRDISFLQTKEVKEKRAKKLMKKVAAFKDNEMVIEFDSISSAAIYVGGECGNIVSGLKLNKIRYGFYWKYI